LSRRGWHHLGAPSRTHWRQNREVDQIGQLGNGPPRTSRIEEAAFGTDTGSDLPAAPERWSTFYIPMRMERNRGDRYSFETELEGWTEKGKSGIAKKKIEN